jgi:hypothetical protein
MPRGQHHRRDPALPGSHLPRSAAEYASHSDPAQAVLTVTLNAGGDADEPYDPEFEQWLSEQAPIADAPMKGALSRAWVATPHRH